MIALGFKKHYRVLHFSNEFAATIVGGVNTHVAEQYRYREPDTGFIHYRHDSDFAVEDYPEREDILIMTKEDQGKLETLDFEILVLHFYDLIHMLSNQLFDKRKLVYVMHSVPTPEPPPKAHAWGGHFDVEQKVRSLCDRATAIVNVSRAELSKLNSIFPEFANKTSYIHNGITLPEDIAVAPVRSPRSRLGFIARMDYRKGLLETLKAIRRLDVELHLACDTGDKRHMHVLNEYIDATGIRDKLHFHGFCVGERKKALLEHVDAVLVPSLYEPFGYTAIEPLLFGKPVIAANNGGIAEILGDGYRYQFAPYSRDGSYEQTLCRFLNDDVETVKEETGRLLGRLRLFDARRMLEKYRELLTFLA